MSQQSFALMEFMLFIEDRDKRCIMNQNITELPR